MEFEWDEEKADINLRKHGISFETTAQCFVSQRITKVDDRKDYGEVRYQTLGMTSFGVVLHIVYTMRGEDYSPHICQKSQQKGADILWAKLSVKNSARSNRRLRLRLRLLKALKDEEIDYSDIPETDEGFWKGAKLVAPAKKQVSMRLDTDVIDWLKSVQPKGYQTLANAILRKEMLSHLEK